MAYYVALTISLLITAAGAVGVYFEITKRRKSPTPSPIPNYLDEVPADEFSGNELPKTEDLHETKKQATLSFLQNVDLKNAAPPHSRFSRDFLATAGANRPRY